VEQIEEETGRGEEKDKSKPAYTADQGDVFSNLNRSMGIFGKLWEFLGIERD
jgi:hypothetical protein